MRTSQRRAAFGLGLSILLFGCGGGGSSGSGVQPPAASSSVPVLAAPASFGDQAIVWGLTHRYGYNGNTGPMVAQFAGGAASGDVDGDGDLDIFMVGGGAHPNRLYLNDGNLSFVESAVSAGLAYTAGPQTNYNHSGPTLADVDGDRDLDLFLGGVGGDPSMLFLNDGTGQFTDGTAGTGLDAMTSVNTISAAFGDYDLDGDLDLALAHWGTPRSAASPGETETLWRNDTAGGTVRFVPVSLPAGISAGLDLSSASGVLGANHDYSFAPSFVDLNGDRYPELLMVSDFRTSHVFGNNGDGTFTDITDPQVILDSNGMGSAVGDFDRDGDFDWFVSSIDGNYLYENERGSFVVAEQSGDTAPGFWGWGSCFADFNGDGYQDIYQTNGWNAGDPPGATPYVVDPTRLWINDFGAGFTDRARDSLIADQEQGRAAVCDDFDADGDVDVLMLAYEPQQQQFLWLNSSTGQNHLKVRVEGIAPNTAAIGARVILTAGGEEQHELVAINSTFTAHSSTEQFFGLGDEAAVEEVRVIWPDGLETVVTSPAINTTLTIQHPNL